METTTRIIAFFLILGLGVVGCTGRSSQTITAPKAASVAKLKCVAILPFENRTKDPDARDAISLLLAEQLVANRRFRVMEADTVVRFLDRQGVRVASVVEDDFAARLGTVLGVDALLMGSVSEYAYHNAGGKSIAVPAVSVTARLVTTAGGNQVWAKSVHQSGEQLFAGNPGSLSRAGILVVEDLISSLPKNVSVSEAMEPCGNFHADLDLDGDGILNVVDQCPFQAEDYNGVDDDDGCPEKGLSVGALSPLVWIENGRLMYRGTIRFMDASDEVVPPSVLLVRAIASFVVKEERRVPRIQIEGYARDSGTSKYREIFSFSRTESVKRILIDGGVDPNRLTSVGYDADAVSGGKERKDIEFLILD